MKRLLVLLALCSAPVLAQEQWCDDNSSSCICSEPFISTSYTRTAFGSNWALFTGDQSGSKICHGHQPASGDTSISVQDTNGSGYTFADQFSISTDSTILSLLPNRDPTSVPRFLRYATDGLSNASRFGYDPINLETACNGSACKRLSMRWYSYHTSNYQWAGDGSCTNGKIAHSSGPNWGNDGVGPYLTLTYLGGTMQSYSFINAGGGFLGWTYTGHATFEGWTNGGPRPGGTFSTSSLRNKWYRHELVVRRPRYADSSVSGFDYSYFVKNVTDDTDEIEVQRMSSGCTSCMPVGGPNFTWSTGVYPNDDMGALHTENYRAGTCNGWVGYLYAVVGGWTTDAGQRIGAATEVEGGGSSVPPPTHFRVIGMWIAWAMLGTVILGSALYVAGTKGFARRRSVRIGSGSPGIRAH